MPDDPGLGRSSRFDTRQRQFFTRNDGLFGK
jgi:hypothetical protein